jgi:hypothetical protein
MFTHIAHVILASRETLASDALGVVAIAAMTLGLLHLPGLG